MVVGEWWWGQPGGGGLREGFDCGSNSLLFSFHGSLLVRITSFVIGPAGTL